MILALVICFKLMGFVFKVIFRILSSSVKVFGTALLTAIAIVCLIVCLV